MTTAMNSDNSLGNATRAMKEAAMEPGTLSPCPLCKTPRSQRTCYVRCNKCGINWEDGADLDINPRRLLNRDKASGPVRKP